MKVRCRKRRNFIIKEKKILTVFKNMLSLAFWATGLQWEYQYSRFTTKNLEPINMRVDVFPVVTVFLYVYNVYWNKYYYFQEQLLFINSRAGGKTNSEYMYFYEFLCWDCVNSRWFFIFMKFPTHSINYYYPYCSQGIPMMNFIIQLTSKWLHI